MKLNCQSIQLCKQLLKILLQLLFQRLLEERRLDSVVLNLSSHSSPTLPYWSAGDLAVGVLLQHGRADGT